MLFRSHESCACTSSHTHFAQFILECYCPCFLCCSRLKRCDFLVFAVYDLASDGDCLYSIGFRTLWMRVVLVSVDILTSLFVLYCALVSMCTVFCGGATCSACMHISMHCFGEECVQSQHCTISLCQRPSCPLTCREAASLVQCLVTLQCTVSYA